MIISPHDFLLDKFLFVNGASWSMSAGSHETGCLILYLAYHDDSS